MRPRQALAEFDVRTRAHHGVERLRGAAEARGADVGARVAENPWNVLDRQRVDGVEQLVQTPVQISEDRKAEGVAHLAAHQAVLQADEDRRNVRRAGRNGDPGGADVLEDAGVRAVPRRDVLHHGDERFVARGAHLLQHRSRVGRRAVRARPLAERVGRARHLRCGHAVQIGDGPQLVGAVVAAPPLAHRRHRLEPARRPVVAARRVRVHEGLVRRLARRRAHRVHRRPRRRRRHVEHEEELQRRPHVGAARRVHRRHVRAGLHRRRRAARVGGDAADRRLLGGEPAGDVPPERVVHRRVEHGRHGALRVFLRRGRLVVADVVGGDGDLGEEQQHREGGGREGERAGHGYCCGCCVLERLDG
mmetsp:Transcript_21674/g.67299  ORF Transcript_21674/g.67299 Transcript_21674/m.67299 type:complete len:362 (+) Transcript_21674:1138-2223(+)